MTILPHTWLLSAMLRSSTSRSDAPVCVTYWINRLQKLPDGAPDTFVTLNPERPPAPEKTFRKLTMAHPVYSFQSYEAQAALPRIQVRRTPRDASKLACLSRVTKFGLLPRHCRLACCCASWPTPPRPASQLAYLSLVA
jgi:hypothetical protein